MKTRRLFLVYALLVWSMLLCASASAAETVSAVIEAPAASQVQVFCQLRAYCAEEVDAADSQPTDHQTVRHTFILPKSSGAYTYRVSMDGFITKAGYLNLSSAEKAAVTVTFDEYENPRERPDYDTATTIGARVEDGVLLNINAQNHLRLQTGDTFRVRAYRTWQIINSDAGNVVIEPDFHFRILSGDCVTLTSDTQSALLKAVHSGTALIEVTYDAIDIGGNTQYAMRYGAIDEARTGLFVVTVDQNMTPAVTMPAWDSELDTAYFFGETGEFSFAPQGSGELRVTCGGATVAPEADGTYRLPIVHGNNVIAVSTSDGTDYLIVKGCRLTVAIENETHPGAPLTQGDRAKIRLDGLWMPLPKLAAVYNPGYGKTAQIAYQTAAGDRVVGESAQYDFIHHHAITLNLWDAGETELTNGTIALSSMGSPRGAHRAIPPEGLATNLNANAWSGEFSILPDLSLAVLPQEDLSFLQAARDSYCNLSSVQILCGTDRWNCSFLVQQATESAASVPNTAVRYYGVQSSHPLTVTAVPANSGVDMTLTYWEEGGARTTLPLEQAQTLHLGTGCFGGESTIHMELSVTPRSPIYGAGRVYSYVFYRATLPCAQRLTVCDADGEPFASPFGILTSARGRGFSYTQTVYDCFVPEDCTAVTLSTNRTVQSAAITGDETVVDFDGMKIRLHRLLRPCVRIAQSDSVWAVEVLADSKTPLFLRTAAYRDQALCAVETTPLPMESGEYVLFFHRSTESRPSTESRLFVWDASMVPY